MMAQTCPSGLADVGTARSVRFQLSWWPKKKKGLLPQRQQQVEKRQKETNQKKRPSQKFPGELHRDVQSLQRTTRRTSRFLFGWHFKP